MKWIKRMIDRMGLVLATVAVALMLHHWPQEEEYNLTTPGLSDSYLVCILYVPLLTTWWLINSVVSHQGRQSLAPGRLSPLLTREQQT